MDRHTHHISLLLVLCLCASLLSPLSGMAEASAKHTTVMVYMCGADLESKSGMATSDLREMASATLSDNMNVIVYTGGAKSWKTNFISNRNHQIYQVASGGLKTLEENAGKGSMTDPSNLAYFIQYGAKNFPADRMELILWDHGGGSITGYGYDEQYPNTGSMNLAGIDKALADGGITFDFIGFDTCLMATLENALMLTKYADYMVASEESEPGVGWYYTNWMTNFAKNTSMPTVEVGKNIVDDFVDVCNQKCAGQKTTLSVIDLAELEKTVPEPFNAFSAGTSKLMEDGSFSQVSQARSGAREFAASSKIDQVDMIDLANKIGTAEAKQLSSVLTSAIKYNRTSSNMTNAYGLSVYFPYRKTSKVDSAVKSYSAIGIDDSYARCIQQFASYETGGQAASGGASSPLMQLLGGGSYTPSSSSSTTGTDAISTLLNGLLGGRMANVEGLDASNSKFLSEGMDVEEVTQYLAENQIDPANIVWTNATGENEGRKVLRLPEAQWGLINEIVLNVWYDDGSGYIDLGNDFVLTFTEDNNLLANYDGTWLAIDGQAVPFYYTGTSETADGIAITGYVPAMLNGERAELLLVFDDANPDGYIAGAHRIYTDGETDTVAKAELELNAGDVIDYICDYYTYDNEYENSYLMGDQHIYTGSEKISNVPVDTMRASAMYRLTDIYGQQYWTPVVE